MESGTNINRAAFKLVGVAFLGEGPKLHDDIAILTASPSKCALCKLCLQLSLKFSSHLLLNFQNFFLQCNILLLCQMLLLYDLLSYSHFSSSSILTFASLPFTSLFLYSPVPYNPCTINNIYYKLYQQCQNCQVWVSSIPRKK